MELGRQFANNNLYGHLVLVLDARGANADFGVHVQQDRDSVSKLDPSGCVVCVICYSFFWRPECGAATVGA